ncbi:MAG: hypothetical protein WD749_14540 [Phycisphaerales bacterium]
MSTPPTGFGPAASGAGAPARAGPLFWALGALLVAYVALCTGQRDNLLEADAWEHHRAIVALVADFWQPGNPTFGGDAAAIPSIRYSPYFVGMVAFARATDLDPWHILSAAAVFNTLLLVVGVRALLGALGRPEVSGVALLVMVGLYGGAPGYANSYALADLPWHQVNPSAFAFGLVLLAWSLFLGLASGRAPKAGWFILPLLFATAMLDHPMTGALGFLGLGIFSVFGAASGAERIRRLTIAVAVGVPAAAACFAWPWFSFLRALTLRPDNQYWFNPGILKMMLTQWCAPAVLLSLWCLAARDQRTIRVLLAGGAACLALGLAAMAARSAALARLPLPGLIFFHLAVAVAAHDAGLLSPRRWIERARALRAGGPAAAAAAHAAVGAAVLAYFLAPQLWAVLREPHLARSPIARALGRPDKQLNLLPQYREALAPVGPRDVVFSDGPTSWPVPSVRGRIVAAIHYEFFVPGQPERERDAARFFEAGPDGATEEERLALLDKYGATWLLLDTARLTGPQRTALLREHAVAARSGDLTLMDAAAWRAAPGPP